MNFGKPHLQQKLALLQSLILCLAITGPLLPDVAFADPAGNTISTVSANSAQDSTRAQNQTGRKQILNDEPKSLSGFFIIGIAVNLFMALAFAWWFFREWRRPRK